MKRIAVLLVASMCMHGAPAQSFKPDKTDMTDKAAPSMKKPAEPPAPGKTPSDPGAVVVPPRTGTEEIVKTPGKTIDPKIDDATEDIDRKNRKKSEQKSAR